MKKPGAGLKNPQPIYILLGVLGALGGKTPLCPLCLCGEKNPVVHSQTKIPNPRNHHDRTRDSTLTTDQIAAAEKLFDLNFSAEQRQQMLKTLTERIANYATIRDNAPRQRRAPVAPLQRQRRRPADRPPSRALIPSARNPPSRGPTISKTSLSIP